MTCLDPRVVPEQFFGPELNTPVIRNAAGRVNKDVINSITLLRSLGDASAVLVIHHTGKAPYNYYYYYYFFLPLGLLLGMVLTQYQIVVRLI